MSWSSTIWAAAGVVVDPPSLDFFDGVVQRAEQALVQALVAQLAVEALDEPILRRFAWRDVVPVDARLHRPLQHGSTGHLAAVVTDDRSRLAAPLDDLVQLGDQTPPRDRRVRHCRQTLFREVIDHGQDAEPPPRRELVGHDVDRR